MGDVSDAPGPVVAAIDYRLSWGPVVRGVRLGAGDDTALLLHDAGRDIDAWGALPWRLSEELPLQVVAFDLPGHGLSDDPWQPERLDELLRELVLPLPSARIVLAPGATALAALRLAAELALTGLVCLSPDALTPSSALTRSPSVPKRLFAGSAAGDDLATARRLAGAAGGWAVVTSLPVAERGTGLLATAWGEPISEAIVAFLRDCQQRRPSLAMSNAISSQAARPR